MCVSWEQPLKGQHHPHFRDLSVHSSTKILMDLCDTPMPSLPRLSKKTVGGMEGCVDFGKGRIWEVKNVVDL